MVDITKEYIEQNLLTSKGYFWHQRAKKINLSTEKAYLIYHNTTPRKCLICNKPTKFVNFSKGYTNSCGNKTCKNKIMIESIKKTNIERHGVKHYFNNEKCLETKLKRYGNRGYNNPIKAKETALKNNSYKKGKEKFKNSKTKKEYKEYYKKVFEKVKETKLKKYGDINYNNYTQGQISRRKTMEEKGYWTRLENISDWEYYKRLVNKLTSEAYKIHKNEINPNKYKRVLCGEEGHQLDHIISVHYGFKNNILPHIISDKDNLQMLLWKENRLKSNKIKGFLND